MSKKVIFIIGTLSSGGAERVVSNLSMNLSKNIKREIILYGKDAKVDYPYEGIITYLDKVKPTNIFNKLITVVRRTLKIRKIKIENPDATIISFTEFPNLFNMLSGKHENSIVSVRNFMSTKYNKGIKSFLWNYSIKKMYRKAKKVIVVSKQMKTDMIENYNLPKEKIEIIHNSYDVEGIIKSSNVGIKGPIKSIFNNPTIITAGRLSKQKGQEHLIRSFKIVKEKIPNSELVILGEGELKCELEALANRLNVNDSVHFLGFKNNPFKYISRSKVFVMTSYYEGFPNALAEAMACRVPVISTDCPSGPREILKTNSEDDFYNKKSESQLYGCLVNPFTGKNSEIVENEISKYIISLIENDELNKVYSEKSLQRIQDFQISSIIEKWENLI